MWVFGTKENMMGAYSKRFVPTSGWSVIPTLDKKLMASLRLLSRQPYSPCPSATCYRNAKEHRGSWMKRGRELSGHSSLTRCGGQGRPTLKWHEVSWCSLLAPPSSCPKVGTARNGMRCPGWMGWDRSRCKAWSPRCPSDARLLLPRITEVVLLLPLSIPNPGPPFPNPGPPFPISFPPSCVSWAISSLSTCLTLDAVAVFLPLFPTFPSPWKSKPLHKPPLLRRPAL
ncbi:hypothetical protein B0T18DRAFT_91780 [Schizothecium vesticola]|uniref:Uncharacterized protein n=1 Tax=Schizothecium vesticola TaxID=314040 RepID=A0AA40F795_9PEZI|nr:hypothetical protein B0T18DRAFT_91780 [Schizothecium vesticola]